MKFGGLVIPDPRVSAERLYKTSKSASKVLVGSVLGGANLNCVVHKGFIHRYSADGRKQRETAEKAVILIRKELADRAVLNLLRRATENENWLTGIPYGLNGTELSWKEFQDNLLFVYSIVPLNLPIECDDCGKKFLLPHSLSCPKGGLVLTRHSDAAKEWVTL